MLQTVQASVLSFQLKWNDKQTDPKLEDLQVSDSYECISSAWVWFWKCSKSHSQAKPNLRQAMNSLICSCHFHSKGMRFTKTLNLWPSSTNCERTKSQLDLHSTLWLYPKPTKASMAKNLDLEHKTAAFFVFRCPVTIYSSVSCRQRDYRRVRLCAGRHIAPSECLCVCVCGRDCVHVCSSNLSLSWLSPPVDLLPCCNTWTAPLSFASASPSLLWFLPSVCVCVCEHAYVCVRLHNSGVIDHPLSGIGEMCEPYFFLTQDVKRKLYPHTGRQTVLLLTHVTICKFKWWDWLEKRKMSLHGGICTTLACSASFEKYRKKHV